MLEDSRSPPSPPPTMSGGLDWGPFGTNIPKAEREKGRGGRASLFSRTRSHGPRALVTRSVTQTFCSLLTFGLYISRVCIHAFLYTHTLSLLLPSIATRGSAYASSPPAVRAFKFIPGPILQGRAWRRGGPIINNNVTGSLAREQVATNWKIRDPLISYLRISVDISGFLHSIFPILSLPSFAKLVESRDW